MRFEHSLGRCARVSGAAAALIFFASASGAAAQGTAPVTVEALQAKLAQAEAEAQRYRQEAAAAKAELLRLRERTKPGTATIAAAEAAPLVQAPAATWQGYYAGVSGGAMSGRSGRARLSGTPLIMAAVRFGEAPATFDIDRRGTLGGIQVGYNWHPNPHVVLGVEADYSLAADGDRHTVGMPRSFSASDDTIISTAAAELQSFGSVRARVGLTPLDRLMIFATAGLAFGEVETSMHLDPTAAVGSFAGSASDPKVGWAAGVGVEYALTSHLSAKVEYLHYDLGTARLSAKDVTGIFATQQALLRVPIGGEILRAGLNVRF